MKSHATFDAYLRNPIESYTVGPIYLLWCYSTRLSGIALWGRLELQHSTSLTRALGRDAHGQRFLSLVDLRRVESIEPSVFDLLTDYLRVRAEKPRGPALALIRPEGYVGAAVTGVCQVQDFPYPIQVFTHPHDALTWLGAIEASHVITELDGALCTLAGATEILRALRTHLGQNPRNADLTTAAAALGMSRRALQRKLREAHTSFQAEHNAAQIGIAKHLLCDPNHEIKRIAFEVGCSSLAAFSALFRRIEGQSPSTWRNQAAIDRASSGPGL